MRVSRDNHTTEQFTKATDHLGSDRMDVRIGGIFALERIARASKDGRERGPVLEILSTYVREHAPKNHSRAEPNSVGAWIRDWLKHTEPPVTDGDPTAVPHLDADVHAALLVLARRSRASADAQLHLARTDLRHAYLAAPRVAVAQLSRDADLQDADLRDADLRDADLREGLLRGADLTGAKLDGARLAGVATDDRTRWPAGFDVGLRTATSIDSEDKEN